MKKNHLRTTVSMLCELEAITYVSFEALPQNKDFLIPPV